MNRQAYLLPALCLMMTPFAAYAAGAAATPLSVREMKSLTAGVYEAPESHGLTLTHIAPGEFVMGSPRTEVGRRDDETPHKVKIARPFYMGIKEVTQAQYMNAMHPDHVEDRMNAGPWAHHLPAFYKGGPWGVERTHVRAPLDSDKPMDTLTWEEAVAYCAWLTAREAAAGRLPEGYVYRLPTEAEWEYACRAGSAGPFGIAGALDTFMDFKADVFDGTTSNPIGRRKANPWGLYDMHGSLYEWVLDDYAPYPSTPSTGSGQAGAAEGEEKVMRGGSYLSYIPAEDQGKSDANTFRSIRSASRSHLPPDFELPTTGMRVVLGPKLR